MIDFKPKDLVGKAALDELDEQLQREMDEANEADEDKTNTLNYYGDEYESWENLYTVAVYGTLKAGCGNDVYLNLSEFMGAGITMESYKMEVKEVPCLFKDECFSPVEVELYNVEDVKDRNFIDNLEGNPWNYKREIVKIVAEDGNVVPAWIYFYQGESNDQSEHYSCYGFTS